MIDFKKIEIGNNVVTGLTDELKAMFINNLYNNYDNDLLIVTSTIYEANNLYNYMSNYNSNVNIFLMDDYVDSQLGVISPELKVSRIELLDNLVTSKSKNIIITNMSGYLKIVPSKNSIVNNTIVLHKTDLLNKDDLFNKLCSSGYTREINVNKTGDIANRGFILDIFPVNSNDPIRIEFFGDEIESIKLFDVDSQRTIQEIEYCCIIPCIDEYNGIDYNISNSLSSYLNNPTIIYIDYNQIVNSYKTMCNDVVEFGENNKVFFHNLEEFSYKYSIYILSVDNILPEIHIDNEINFSSSKIDDFQNLSYFKDFIIRNINKKYVIICFNDINEIDRFKKQYEFNFNDDYTSFKKNCINLKILKLSESFQIDDYIYISINSLVSHKNISKFKSKFKIGTSIDNYKSLKKGDYVVHEGHGIGIYNGIVSLNNKNIIKDYLEVLYDDNGKLYVPVEKIELLTKYSYDSSIEPKINKLGGNEWEKTKLRVKGRLQNIAKDLIKVAAERKQKPGFPFKKDVEEQIIFENEFPYDETDDQLKAVVKIKECMERPYPMDVLLCGDVGYGKTEVAFRAIFKAICSNKQVVYLCPTTILSNQQYLSALDRFKNYPVNIALLNRFTSYSEFNRIVHDLKDGKIDIIFGTHRVLNDSITYKDLGLLVIDEEQRFGVTHKEKIKQLKTSIDVLTLSATPIPRTLQMSLLGIRDLALIETPPSNRFPVQTYVLEENESIIKNAIYKELSRNGQVFILCNKIESFDSIKMKIVNLIPEIKIDYVHGKMDKDDIENVMYNFIEKKFDVLVCTTIIETGIDIPNTNTLIILDADKFGLSQLYQIRGRVGRSDRVAYCYLMYKKNKVLSEIASKRLNSIKEFASLGSGFKIAMRDLSIRGAGDVLGSMQSGFIDQIGIDLYMKMLNNEIDIINGVKEDEEKSYNINSSMVSTHIEDSYVYDDELKIEIHKLINSIDSYDSLINTKKELEDRFGKLSKSIIIYMYEQLLNNIKEEKGIKTIIQNLNEIKLVFNKGFEKTINIDELFINSYKISHNFKFNMDNNCFNIILSTDKLDKHWVFYVLDILNCI